MKETHGREGGTETEREKGREAGREEEGEGIGAVIFR